MNTALHISYCGSSFHGWQRQKNADTIQEEMENALGSLCGKNPYVSGCGRTDAGVHAKIYVCNFKGECPVPLKKLPSVLNGILPSGIAVLGAYPVSDDFDARFSCISKEYTYVFSTAEHPDPFMADREYRIFYSPDVRIMEKCGEVISGRHDFACFQNVGTPQKSTVRTVMYCTTEKLGDRITVRVRADGFLYNMVRNIAGTLLYAGIGKIKPDELAALMEKGDRVIMGPTLPPQGLYLTGLTYGMEELDGQKSPFEIR